MVAGDNRLAGIMFALALPSASNAQSGATNGQRCEVWASPISMPTGTVTWSLEGEAVGGKCPLSV